MTPPATPETTVEQQERQLQARGWPGVKQLAERWGLTRYSVRHIPREKLPYLSFGLTDIRRYDPMDVDAFEQREKQPAKSQEVAA